ncbi:MAG: histidine triad nucleotide-binding protein [Deltaproteobacteria bacterium]
MDGSESDCVFCNIVQGKASADVVYEDEFVVGFWDARPARPVHILIVPRTHIPTLNDISEDDHILSHIGQAAARIAADFGVADSGYRLLINVNREGGQVIFHLHAHLMAGRKRGSI